MSFSKAGQSWLRNFFALVGWRHRDWSVYNDPFVLFCLLTLVHFVNGVSVSTAEDRMPAETLAPFLKTYCADCHGDGESEGGFALDLLGEDITTKSNFDLWVRIYDRIDAGEMPPPDAELPPLEQKVKTLATIRRALVQTQNQIQAKNGRVTARRMNAVEFENALSDIFQTPLDIADLLPEDARQEGFTTVGSALNISRVQMESYLEAIDAAIDQSIQMTERPKTQKFRLSALNTVGYMQTYRASQPALPVVDGMKLFATEEMSSHNALWGQYVVPRTGRYRVKVSAYKFNSQDPLSLTVRVGGSGHKESLRVKHRLLTHLEIQSDKPEIHQWEGELLRGHFFHLCPSELKPYRFAKNKVYEQVRYKGPGVCVQWLEIEGPIVDSWPPSGEKVLFGGVDTKVIANSSNPDPNKQLYSPPIIPADPILLPRDWPRGKKWNRLAGTFNEKAKFPARDYSQRRAKIIRKITNGIHPAAKPLPDYTKSPYNLPIGSPLPSYGGEPVYLDAKFPGELVRTREFDSANPKADAARLIRRILPLAFRRPVPRSEANRFVRFVHRWIDEGIPFEQAMRTGYKAVFTSPQFLFHQGSLPAKSNRDSSLDQFALAERLAFFLWSSLPDSELIRLAERGKLNDPVVLREQVERLFADSRSKRFVHQFLGQWLDLHEIDFTSPDTQLYPEFDPVLKWSMLEESHAFFRHLLDRDLPVSNLIDSKFLTINRRLGQHYGMEGITGMQPSFVEISKDSVRGGVMTQAAVLKVTANGSNTSPVVRGVWVLERLVGNPTPPPPAGVPAVEPDIRGTVTIRQQIEKHRSASECASCHAKIDPPGVALESFDPVGRFRTNYRILDPEKKDLKKRDRRIRYNDGLAVDPSYQLSGGERFQDVRGLKEIMMSDKRAIARSLVKQILVYSTGATVTFADRAELEQILDVAAEHDYGLRSILHAIILSDLFQSR